MKLFSKGSPLRFLGITFMLLSCLLIGSVVMFRVTDGNRENRYERILEITRDTISGKNSDLQGNTGGNSPESTTQGGLNNDSIYQVEPTVAEEVAETPSKGLNEPALQLLPMHWGRQLSEKQLSEKDRDDLENIIRGFIPVWETFTPGDTEYRNRLTRIGANTGDGIVERRDSKQQKGVCIAQECTTASTFSEEYDPGDYMTVYGFDDVYAYVTTKGVVRYNSFEKEQETRIYSEERFSSAWIRDYAIILKKDTDSGQWHIMRVAAETVRAY